MEEKVPVSGLLPEEIVTALQLSPEYRGVQIFKALWSGISSFENITTLSKALRREIGLKAVLYQTELVSISSDSEGTNKMVIRCADGFHIETVLLSDREQRRTLCLSTQAGCGMGCVFCKTGTLGFIRNLTAAEISEQVLHSYTQFGTFSNIVFMGMGEPLLNLDAVNHSVSLITHPEGLRLGFPRITLSTCGIIAGIQRLLREGPSYRLALSLVSAIQSKREKLIPAASANPLPELKKALMEYQSMTKKRLTFEYVLIPGENDGPEDVEALGVFCKDFSAILNIIPWNAVEGLPYRPPSEAEIQQLTTRCDREGIHWTRRYRRGSDINGACGQLGGYTSPSA